MIKIGGYSRDVLVVKGLIKNSKNKLIVVKDATKHYAEKNLFNLAKKKFMWGRKYFVRKDEGFDYLPKTGREVLSFSTNFIFNLLIVPNFVYSLIIYSKSKDFVSFLFPVMAFLNTFVYGLNFIR
jgi:hypothetical protein